MLSPHPRYYAIDRADEAGDWVAVGYKLHRAGNGATIIAAGVPRRVADVIYIAIGKFEAVGPIAANSAVVFDEHERISQA